MIPPTALTFHPESDRLARSLERCLALAMAWRGDLFRFTSLNYANQRDLITGEGSRKAGARWNPKGSFQALYGSLDPTTALEEVLAYRRSQGLPDAEALPLILVGLRVELQQVLDLRSGIVRRSLKVSGKRMMSETWRSIQNAGQEALTQAIGRLARQTGFEGLLTPSAVRSGASNLVLFPDRFITTSRLEIIHGEYLPMSSKRK